MLFCKEKKKKSPPPKMKNKGPFPPRNCEVPYGKVLLKWPLLFNDK